MKARFKIDFSGQSYPFALFHWKGLVRGWVRIDYFTTIGECRELYKKIKDLPEYLP